MGDEVQVHLEGRARFQEGEALGRGSEEQMRPRSAYGRIVQMLE